MNFHDQAISAWQEFLQTKVNHYKKYRNYDYGPLSDSYVSKISPFISHRVLFEYQIIAELNSKYNPSLVNKYLEEVFWRIFWKGWLEIKPCVWNEFISNKQIKFDDSLYEKALKGITKLDYFNAWVKELKKYNYLHNHTRMWFASTWIYTLGLPWQLGARFFFEHLYDGDAASNLLSWRWVAGLHTKGKRYLFNSENLRKFSNNRFLVKNIDHKNIREEDEFLFEESEEIFNCDMERDSNHLILFENDMHFETLESVIKNYQKVYLILLDNADRKLKLSKKVFNFKKKLTLEFSQRFENVDLISSSEIYKKLRKINHLDMIYPCIGDNNDFIKKFQIENNKSIKNLVREEDLFSWKFAKKGFFRFKQNIPLILSFIQNE